MQKPTTSQRIVEEIKDSIRSGALSPGQRLDEVSLATRFSVSRTPIREALNHLIASSILISKGRRGVYVAEVSKEDLALMYEAMSQIEALCASLAARRMSWLQRAQLETVQRKCLQAAQDKNAEAFIRLNDQFHGIIYQATQNKYLERIAMDFRQRTAPWRTRRFNEQSQMLATVEAHDRIVRAINASEPLQAHADMLEHINSEIGGMETEV